MALCGWCERTYRGRWLRLTFGDGAVHEIDQAACGKRRRPRADPR
jgi:hypothetical protein